MKKVLENIVVFMGIMIFDLSVCTVFPLILLTLIYKPVGHWAPLNVQALVYWLGTTTFTIIIYFLGNRLLAYTIGLKRFTLKELHKINLLLICFYTLLFMLTVYLTQ